MAYTEVVQTATLEACGAGDGIPTRELHSGDNSATWARGMLLKIASGVITPCRARTTAAVFDSDDMPAAGTYFVAAEPVAVATAEKVPVVQINSSQIFKAVLVQSSTDTLPTAPESIVGAKYGLWQAADGKIAVDKDTTSKPLVEVVKVEGDSDPYRSSVLNAVDHAGTDKIYPFVWVKFLPAIVDRAGA